jgi:hypothetical protein
MSAGWRGVNLPALKGGELNPQGIKVLIKPGNNNIKNITSNAMIIIILYFGEIFNIFLYSMNPPRRRAAGY